MLRKACCMIAGLLIFSVSIFAHHGSRISYDLKKRVTVSGAVTQYVWGNPHVYILFDVKDDKGNIAHWGTETYSPIIMATHGWSRKTFKPGDQITVTHFPSKEGSPRGFLEKIVYPDGTVMNLGNPTE